MKKIVITISGMIIAGLSPVFPTDMQLAYSYSFEYEPITYTRNATTTEFMPDVVYPFPDSDGDGKGFASVFIDNNGNEVIVEITEAQYRKMGEAGGYQHNTEKTEYLNAIEVFKADEVKAEIARDNATAGNASSASSLTYAHTVTGSDLILVAGTMLLDGTPSTFSSVTYDGTAMTKVDDFPWADGLRRSATWYLINPSTGANNVVVTAGASQVWVRAVVASYTGTNQSSQPDNNSEKSQASGSTMTDSLTTVADNAWLVGWGSNRSNDLTAGTDTTEIASATNDEPSMFENSNGALSPAGSYSLEYTMPDSIGESVLQMMSIAPAVDEERRRVISF